MANATYSGVLGLGVVPENTPTVFPASGDVASINVSFDSQKTESGKPVLEGNDRVAYHGVLEGELAEKFTTTIGMSNGNYTVMGKTTFTGKVDGKEGTFTVGGNTSGQMTSLTDETSALNERRSRRLFDITLQLIPGRLYDFLTSPGLELDEVMPGGG